jgi:hypothetical protein
VIALCKRDKVSLAKDGGLSDVFGFRKLFSIDRALARMGPGANLEQLK